MLSILIKFTFKSLEVLRKKVLNQEAIQTHHKKLLLLKVQLLIDLIHNIKERKRFGKNGNLKMKMKIFLLTVLKNLKIIK